MRGLKNRWQNFMPFGSSQYKDSVCRWLFQSFKERIKRIAAQHVHLIYNINFVFANLWWYPYLFHQLPNIVHRIVGSRIQLKNIKGKIVIGVNAWVGLGINNSCQDSCAGSFTNTTRPGK